MKLSPKEIDRAKAIVNQEPGIPIDRFARRMGIVLESDGRNRLKPVNNLIKALTQAGVLYSQRDQFATNFELPKVYPAGYVKPQKQLFRPIADLHRTECRTYTVSPKEIDQHTPKYNRPVSPLRPITLAAAEDEKMPFRSKEEIKLDISRVLKELKDKGQPFKKTTVVHEVGINHDFLSRNPEINEWITQAAAESQPKTIEKAAPVAAKAMSAASTTIVECTPPIPPDPTFNLKARIALLEQQNATLQKRVEIAETQAAQAMPPTSWIKSKREQAHAQLDKLSQEATELMLRLKAIEAEQGKTQSQICVFDELLAQMEALC